MEEIARSGADDISLRALARKVGVSHQAPLHVFGSRRGLLTAVATAAVDSLTEDLAAAAARVEAAQGPGADAVLAIGLTYIEATLRERALFALTARADALDIDDPAFRAARAAAWGVLLATVERAQAAGWRTDQPTDLVALTSWSLVQGLAVIYRDQLAPDDLADRAPEELMRVIAGLL